MKRLTWIFAALGMTMLACGPTDLARDLLGRLPTITPTATLAIESHDSETWYVATDGDDANSCSDPAASCRTIQAAIDKAGDDDVIQIAPGTYVEHYSRAAAGMWIDGKELSLRGSGSEATFLEPDAPGRAVLVIRDADVGLSRLTVQGAQRGAFGISTSRSHLRLSDAVVQDNEGIGVIAEGVGSTIEFSNLTVRRNVGGLALAADGTIRGSLIVENLGSGIVSGGVLTVSETVIEGNRAENGPGITNNAGGQLTLERSTVARNTATAATHSRALAISNEGSMILLNSTVSNNGIVSGGSGGAITTRGELTLSYSTVAANEGAGIIGFGGSITFDNALIADHDAGDCDITSSSSSFLGVTLDSDESCTRWRSSENGARTFCY